MRRKPKPLAIAMLGGKTVVKRPINQSGETGWFHIKSNKRLLPHEEIEMNQRGLWP